jgi:hypothetical protein
VHRLLNPALLLMIAALLPAAALGKGATEATITGPGLEEPIVLTGVGEPGTDQLMTLSGFFPAVFEQTPDPMRDTRPAGELGPEYVVRYVMPGPDHETDTIVQKLYPYASAGPVSYVEPGQLFWTTEEASGGWYVPGGTLRDLLVAAGLPATAPPVDSTRSSDSPWAVIAPIAALLAIGAGALAVALLVERDRSRRYQTRTVTTSRSAS